MGKTITQNGDVKDWGEGWKQVLDAIRKYGSYRAKDAMESLDSITRQCVERIGFNNICMSENIEADRAIFGMIYEQIAERERRGEGKRMAKDSVENIMEQIKEKYEKLKKENEKISRENMRLYGENERLKSECNELLKRLNYGVESANLVKEVDKFKRENERLLKGNAMLSERVVVLRNFIKEIL